MLIVFAGNRKCRELAMVWSHIQQQCGTLLPCLEALLTYLLSVVRDFGFTLDEVNWLGNIIACVYLPTAFLTPIITKRYGLKRSVWSVSHRCGTSSHLDSYSVTLLLSYFYYRRGSVTLELHGHCPRVAPIPSSLLVRWEKQP